MALDRDTILAENLKESLNLYQRSIVWAMTASAAFFLLTFTLGDPTFPTVSVLYGKLSGPAAWFVALGLFFVLGILAGSALHNAEAVLLRLRAARGVSSQPQVDDDVLEALMLYPSLATSPTGFVRIGTVFFSPIAVLVGFGIELFRESTSAPPRDIWWWSGFALFVLLVAVPYVEIARRLWHPIGSRSNKPLQPTSGVSASG